MLRVTLAGLRAHKLRLVATALAIVLGVGFVAGTLIFGDTARVALFDQFARAAQNVDVAVRTPTSTLDAVRAVPGVAEADGRMQAFLPLLDRNGKVSGPGVGISAGNVPRLRPYDLEEGRIPTGPGEAALDAETATRTGFRVGDTVTVLDQRQRRHQLTLVGLIGFGTSKEYADQSVLALAPPTLTALSGATGYQQVVIGAAAGVTPGELATRVRAALPGARVSTGAQYRLELANGAISQVQTFLTVVLAFAVIACVVSAFVIYNTFTILVAQRIRELALLRCVGAGRRQLFGSVLIEAAVVGLIGAAAGVGLGLAVAYGLFSGADALGAALPRHALVLGARPVLVALLIGVVVTVASAVVPAVRATRVPPLAALRVAPDPGVGTVRGRVTLIVLAALCGTAGTLVTVAGTAVDDNQAGTLLVIAGGLVNFLAVLLLSPLFVGPLTAAVGWLPGRLFGVPARLATANARRNPGRAAATTAALMIGVGLMSSASVSVATVKRTADEQIAAHYPVDYVLQPGAAASRDTLVPPEVASRLRSARGIGEVASVRLKQSTVNGERITVGAVDRPSLVAPAGPGIDLRPGTVIFFADSGAPKGLHTGDRVRVGTATLTVAGVASGRSEVGGALITWADFTRLFPATGDNLVLVKAAAGVPPAGSRAAVDAATEAYPLVSVLSVAQWRADISSAVDQLITVVATLLAFAILIALIGIMNTLSLSVFERTRESATIRALGLTRGQLSVTLLVEALLMGAVGALVGVSFGLLYGWVTCRVLFSGFAASVTVPIGQLLLYVALAALAAVVAAVLPARRAARSSIVAAMADA